MEYLGYFFNKRISDRSELTPSSQLAPLPPPPPPPPHQDTQAYEKGNIPHANSKDQKQHTHPKAEIGVYQPETFNVEHCEK